MPARECPRCKLLNDADATTCDCGYEFATGALRLQRPLRDLSHAQRQDIVETAVAYRHLVGVVFFQAVAGGASRIAARVGRDELTAEGRLGVSVISVAVLLLLGLLAATLAHRVARGIGAESPAVWAIAVFLTGILALVVVGPRLHDWARANGLAVGLLGPKGADLARLERGG